MATPTRHFRLGLFIVVGVALALGAVLIFGARSLSTDHVRYTTYYDESVQGLEIGAPVKFRGVTVGSVTQITVAPDKRRVAVALEVEASEVGNVGIKDAPFDEGLRVQLAAAGITGVKFLQIDFFDPESYPPPVLPFEVPERYLPAAVSTLKQVEDSVVGSMARFPEMVDAVVRSTAQLSRIMDKLEAADLPGATKATLARADRVLALLERELDGVDLEGLSGQAKQTLARVDALTQSVTRASEAYGQLATGEVAAELPETLRAIRDATAKVGRLAETLEIDPDMLLKGRSKGK